MLKHLFRRTCIAIPTMLLVLTIVFFLMRMIPGSPADAMLKGEDVTKEDIEALEEALGLNDPLPVQYVRYLGNIVTGNWGDSYIYDKPVFGRMFERWEPAIFMAIMATVVTVFIAFPVGILSATHRNSIGDYITTTSAIAMQSIPTICWSLLLIYFFGYMIPIFKTGGYVYIEDGGFWKALYSMTLPALALGLHHVAGQVRYVRTTMLDVLNQDYVRTAKSKGLPQYKVYYKHAMKNTLNITGTMVISSFVSMLGGTSVTEKAFNIYGLGTLAIQALSLRDYPQEQAIVIWSSGVSVLMGLFMDVFYYWLDPRIKYE